MNTAVAKATNRDAEAGTPVHVGIYYIHFARLGTAADPLLADRYPALLVQTGTFQVRQQSGEDNIRKLYSRIVVVVLSLRAIASIPLS